MIIVIAVYHRVIAGVLVYHDDRRQRRRLCRSPIPNSSIKTGSILVLQGNDFSDENCHQRIIGPQRGNDTFEFDQGALIALPPVKVIGTQMHNHNVWCIPC